MLVTALSTFFMFRCRDVRHGHDDAGMCRGRPAPGGSCGFCCAALRSVRIRTKLDEEEDPLVPLIILADDQAVGDLPRRSTTL